MQAKTVRSQIHCRKHLILSGLFSCPRQHRRRDEKFVKIILLYDRLMTIPASASRGEYRTPKLQKLFIPF